MIQLCDEIAKRGGTPEDPLFYKNLYNDRLNVHIQGRISALKTAGSTWEMVCSWCI